MLYAYAQKTVCGTGPEMCIFVFCEPVQSKFWACVAAQGPVIQMSQLMTHQCLQWTHLEKK